MGTKLSIEDLDLDFRLSSRPLRDLRVGPFVYRHVEHSPYEYFAPGMQKINISRIKRIAHANGWAVKKIDIDRGIE